ncbi:APC family permease [Streptomyces nojiriensis]|uniref:APC family permease n=1 Tax=Streptomyces nojiriensis TaxID=66374 RepID=UPI00364A5338
MLVVVAVALTFFVLLGFGIITLTARDPACPESQLPRAMYLGLGIATVIYIAIALGVFGTLTFEEVVSSGGTALAVAAEPTLGQAGYWLMSVTALFATAGATNAGLYPAAGLSERLADNGLFPPLMARKVGGRATAVRGSRLPRARHRVQTRSDRLDRQRCRPAHLRTHHRPPPRAQRDRCQPGDPRARDYVEDLGGFVRRRTAVAASAAVAASRMKPRL